MLMKAKWARLPLPLSQLLLAEACMPLPPEVRCRPPA